MYAKCCQCGVADAIRDSVPYTCVVSYVSSSDQLVHTSDKKSTLTWAPLSGTYVLAMLAELQHYVSSSATAIQELTWL